MAKGNLPTCLKITLSHEGGWSDHPRDPGGATMKGVTLAVFRRWYPGATKADLRAISDADVEKIYRVGYWNPVRGDDLPAGVDLAVFDFAVNSGVSRAARYLQAVVGAKQDGVVGPVTVKASASASPVATVKAICARRLSFVRGLRTFSTFGRGWSRRIADVEARAAAMALSAADVPFAVGRMKSEARIASKAAGAQSKASSGVFAAGGAGGLAETATGDVNWLIVGVVVVAGVALAGFLRSRAMINQDRAEAYERVIGG